MVGVKRPRESGDGSQTSISPYMPMFEHFRQELDEHHDRRERVIKLSRDITASSKKMIFSLQRVPRLNEQLSADLEKDLAKRKGEMLKMFESVAADLIGINAWRYQRQISGALQEYVEALSFEHYLTTQTLISPDQASATVGGGVRLTPEDYILGIFDLVGELMRFAVTQMATYGLLPGQQESQRPGLAASGTTRSKDERRDILGDMRCLRASFESLNTRTTSNSASLAKDIEKKMEVMRTSVEKVEFATYGIILRGRERPKGWVPALTDDFGGAGPEPIASYE